MGMSYYTSRGIDPYVNQLTGKIDVKPLASEYDPKNLPAPASYGAGHRKVSVESDVAKLKQIQAKADAELQAKMDESKKERFLQEVVQKRVVEEYQRPKSTFETITGEQLPPTGQTVQWTARPSDGVVDYTVASESERLGKYPKGVIVTSVSPKTTTVTEDEKVFGVTNPLAGADRFVSGVLNYSLPKGVKKEQVYSFLETNIAKSQEYHVADVFKTPTPETYLKTAFSLSLAKPTEFMYGIGKEYLERPVTQAALTGIGYGVGKFLRVGGLSLERGVTMHDIKPSAAKKVVNFAKVAGVGLTSASVGFAGYEIFTSERPIQKAGKITAQSVSFGIGMERGITSTLYDKELTEFGHKVITGKYPIQTRYLSEEGAAGLALRQEVRQVQHETMAETAKRIQKSNEAVRRIMDSQTQDIFTVTKPKLQQVLMTPQYDVIQSFKLPSTIISEYSSPKLFVTSQVKTKQMFDNIVSTKQRTITPTVQSTKLKTLLLQDTITKQQTTQTTKLDQYLKQLLITQTVLKTPLKLDQQLVTKQLQTQLLTKQLQTQLLVTPLKQITTTTTVATSILTPTKLLAPPGLFGSYRRGGRRRKTLAYTEFVPVWKPIQAVFGGLKIKKNRRWY